MITWEELMKFPSLQDVSPLRAKDKQRLFHTVQYVWAPMILTDPDCLYLVGEAARETVSAMDGTSAIVLGEGWSGEVPDGLSNLAVLPMERAGLFQQELDSSNERAIRCREERRSLLRLVTGNAGLDAMAAELTNWMGRPVGVVDMNFKFLTRTMEEQMDRSVLESDVDPRGVTQKRLKQLYEDGYAEKALMTSDVLFFDLGGDFTIYEVPLQIEGVHIGFLGVTGSKVEGTAELPPEYVHELPTIAELFSIELAKNDMYVQNGQKSLAYIFSMILENEPEDLDTIRNRMRIYDYTMLQDFYLMYVPVPSDKDKPVTFIASTLQSVFSNSIYLIRQEDILFLISRPEHRRLSEFELNVWDSQLRQLGLHGGLSPVFRDFREIRKRYLKEAKLALKGGKAVNSDQGLYRFEDYQVDALLADEAVSNDLQIYCFPPLMRLIEYDWQKRLNLIETLRAVLKYPKTHEVCEKLYIHKNTLYKRIAKIEEIMGCSISDPDVIMKIQLTFHILHREPE